MEWLSILLGCLTTLFAGLNIFQLFSFRAYKAKHVAVAGKDEAEAMLSKQTALEQRLAAVEKLYAEQGKMLDELRTEYLKLKEEKFESEKRIVQFENENLILKKRIDLLEQQTKKK